MSLASQPSARAALAALALGLALQPASASAAERHRDGGAPAPIERQHEPRGYMRPAFPRGADHRPAGLDRSYLNHNFHATHGFAIGPYHGPAHGTYQRWRHGDVLPPIFWSRPYWLSDYWLFGLDVPPVGYEWVRYWNDAVLVDVRTGEIVQIVYGNFL